MKRYSSNSLNKKALELVTRVPYLHIYKLQYEFIYTLKKDIRDKKINIMKI